MKALVNVVAALLCVAAFLALLHVFGCTEDLGLRELLRG